MRTIACVVGARPNLVKMGPILRALRATAQMRTPLVHTGQHYDEAMSDVFFRQLDLPRPDAHLGVGSGTQGAQTATILARFEDWLLHVSPKPDATLVVGDVNSTMACALASVKLEIPVIHVEAGLRSFDRSMPEEINRIVTDSISALHLVSEPSGVENLRREGHAEPTLRLVGNIMIDALHEQMPAARALRQYEQLGVDAGSYVLWTMHRPANVDDPDVLTMLVTALAEISTRIPVVFPVHPRTRTRLEASGGLAMLDAAPGVRVTAPLGYLEFLSLSAHSRIIVTDSGGLQEESTALGIPCLTLRTTTERPITVSEGTSMLVGSDTILLGQLVDAVLAGTFKIGRSPALWDGHAGERIAAEITAFVR